MTSFKAESGRVNNFFNGTTSATAINSNTISASGIYADAFYIGRSESAQLVQKELRMGTVTFTNSFVLGTGTSGGLDIGHYHAISASASGGVITITQGAAQATQPDPATFNIADTQYYKDGVASAWTNAYNTVRINNNGSGTAGPGSKTISLSSGSVEVYAQAKDNANASIWTTVGTVTVDATAAVNAGWTSAIGTVRINNSSSGVGNNTVNLASGGSVTVYAQAKDNSDASIYTTYGTVTVNAEAVTIDSVNGKQGTTFNTYYIPVTMTATASNQATGTNTMNVNASGVYSAGQSSGWTNAYNTVRVNNNKGTGSGSQTISLDYGGSAEVYAQVKASSSATAWSTVGTVTVNAPAAVPLTTGTFTTNGTKTPGSGYSGFSSVTINVPTGYTGLTVDTTNKRVTVSTSTTTTYATISAGTITAQETTTAGQNVLSVPI